METGGEGLFFFFLLSQIHFSGVSLCCCRSSAARAVGEWESVQGAKAERAEVKKKGTESGWEAAGMMAIIGPVKSRLGSTAHSEGLGAKVPTGAAQDGKYAAVVGETCRARVPPETRLTVIRHNARIAVQDRAEQGPIQCSIACYPRCTALRPAPLASPTRATCYFIFRTRAGRSRPSHSDLILRTTPPQHTPLIASRHVESEHNKVLDQVVTL